MPRARQKKHKIVAVLPCRINSTRLFAKQFQPLNNQSIIEFLVNQIKKSKLIDNIVLAVSKNPGNEIFIQFAKKNGLKFCLGDEDNVLKRIIKSGQMLNATTIVRTTPENPYIYWQGIDQLIESHMKGNHDLSFYQGLPLGSNLEIIEMESLLKSYKNSQKKHRGELSTLYFYEHPKEFKINEVLPDKILRRPQIRLTVDTPEDLILARIIFTNLSKGKSPIPLEKIIQFLDNNPSIQKINSHVSVKYKRYY